MAHYKLIEYPLFNGKVEKKNGKVLREHIILEESFVEDFNDKFNHKEYVELSEKEVEKLFSKPKAEPKKPKAKGKVEEDDEEEGDDSNPSYAHPISDINEEPKA